MARWYSSFTNSTVSSLEADSTGKRFQRKAMSGGATLRSALVAARDSLSAAVYAQLNAENRRGDTGICLPEGGFTMDGTNLSWTSLYTNPDAIWPADPSDRPNASIEAAFSTPIGDAGSISQSLYNAAQSSLEDILTAAGFRSRVGNSEAEERMLRSLFHDHALSYFAWDDFLPGRPQNVVCPSIEGFKGNANSIRVDVTFDKEYPADVECEARLDATVYCNGSPAQSIDEWRDFNWTGGSTGLLSWNLPGGGVLPAGDYSIEGYVQFKPVGMSGAGLSQYFSNAALMTVVEGPDQ